MKRTPMKRRYRDTGPDAATEALVAERSGGMCEICGQEHATEYHHRVPRGMGGTKDPRVNQASSLLHVSRRCHRYAETHRAEALIAGWLVSRYSNPADVAVLINNGSRYVYLGADGLYHDNPPEVAA